MTHNLNINLWHTVLSISSSAPSATAAPTLPTYVPQRDQSAHACPSIAGTCIPSPTTCCSPVALAHIRCVKVCIELW